MQHYFYSVIACIALVVHLALNFRLLAGRHVAYMVRGMGECRTFLISLLVYYVADVLWGVFDGRE